MSAEPIEPEHLEAPSREKLAVLLRGLRGEVTIAEVARRLPAGSGGERTTSSRQSWMDLERGWHLRKDRKDQPARWQIANPTLERLETIGEALGVTFEIIARDVRTGAVVLRDAPALRQPDPGGALR